MRAKVDRLIVYLPAPGRDMPSFHGHLPFYNGQQIVFAPPQAGHGLFLGIYPAVQAETASSTIQQQQQFSRYSLSMAGNGETAGVLPSTSYQMPPHIGINSTTNYALQ